MSVLALCQFLSTSMCGSQVDSLFSRKIQDIYQKQACHQKCWVNGKWPSIFGKLPYVFTKWVSPNLNIIRYVYLASIYMYLSRHKQNIFSNISKIITYIMNRMYLCGTCGYFLLLPLLFWNDVISQCTDMQVVQMADMYQTIMTFNSTVNILQETINRQVC